MVNGNYLIKVTVDTFQTQVHFHDHQATTASSVVAARLFIMPFNSFTLNTSPKLCCQNHNAK